MPAIEIAMEIENEGMIQARKQTYTCNAKCAKDSCGKTEEKPGTTLFEG